jgi:hypothetical protein
LPYQPNMGVTPSPFVAPHPSRVYQTGMEPLGNGL